MAVTEQRTQDRVRHLVATRAPISATKIATELQLSAAGVRRHLDNLEANGIIEVQRISPETAKAGRPSKRYVLSQVGQGELGNDYLSIARNLLQRLTVSNPTAVKDFAASHFADVEQRVRARMSKDAGSQDLEQLASLLAQELNDEGFLASLSTLSSASGELHGAQMCQGHCPLQDLASDFPEFCEAETEMFARLLGVDVRRLSTLARGSHVCTTHIPVGRTGLEVREQTTARSAKGVSS